MKAPRPHKRESERQAKVESYNILDSLPEPDYDNITRLAAYICGTPISLITMLDNDRNWFKSHFGTDLTESPRAYSFCGHAIHNEHELFEVSDLREDERFHDNPIVAGETNIVYYAGVPLLAEEGLPLGTLCVFDVQPRKLDQQQAEAMKALSSQVMNLLNLRKREQQLKTALDQLVSRNEELERFAALAAHDLKSPLKSIGMLTQLLIAEHRDELSENANEIVSHIDKSSHRLVDMVSQLLAYSRDPMFNEQPSEVLDLSSFCKEVLSLIEHNHQVELNVHGDLQEVVTNKAVLERILINLFSNAIKYNDQDQVVIDVNVKQSKDQMIIAVSDNGVGIPKGHLQKIFQIFHVAANKDRDGHQGHGIGLAAVKNLVEGQGGSISAAPRRPSGSTFTFSIPL